MCSGGVIYPKWASDIGHINFNSKKNSLKMWMIYDVCYQFKSSICDTWHMAHTHISKMHQFNEINAMMRLWGLCYIQCP